MRVKAYTDIEQSRRLSHLLPKETADMHYCYDDDLGELENIPDFTEETDHFELFPKDIACWSLGKLMDILPNTLKTGASFRNRFQINVRKYDGANDTTWYQIAYGNNAGLSGSWHDMVNTGERENLVDACVDMIILLIKEKYLRYDEQS